jgi:hypothetical protein
MEAATAGDLKAVGERILAPMLASTAVLGPKAAAAAGKAFAERVAN